jgi:hypothetical protein
MSITYVLDVNDAYMVAPVFRKSFLPEVLGRLPKGLAEEMGEKRPEGFEAGTGGDLGKNLVDAERGKAVDQGPGGDGALEGEFGSGFELVGDLEKNAEGGAGSPFEFGIEGFPEACAEDDGEVSGVEAGKAKVGHASGEHLLGGAGDAGGGLAEFAGEEVVAVAGEFGEESVLIREVAVGGGNGDAGESRGFIEGEAARPLFLYKAEGGLLEGGLEVAVMVGAIGLLADGEFAPGGSRVHVGPLAAQVSMMLTPAPG